MKEKNRIIKVIWLILFVIQIALLIIKSFWNQNLSGFIVFLPIIIPAIGYVIGWLLYKSILIKMVYPSGITEEYGEFISKETPAGFIEGDIDEG